jgi:hypothetical protein
VFRLPVAFGQGEYLLPMEHSFVSAFYSRHRRSPCG